MLTIAFSALIEPRSERRGELIGLHAKAGFEAAFTGRQGVVKIRGICEIAHAETIKPFERTRLAFISDDEIDGEFLRVHEKEYNLPARLRSSLEIWPKRFAFRFEKVYATLHSGFLAKCALRAIHFYIEKIKLCL